MLPPPKKVWKRFASKVISKLGRFPRPSESITRTTLRFLSRLGTAGPGGRHRCCRCSCHGHQPEYWVQVRHRSFWNNNNHNMEVEIKDELGVDDEDEELEAMEDQAVDEKAEEFIAKFHETLKLERLQHF